ncbi:MAG: FMN-binding protein [Clostridiales bacterium]
MNKIIKLTVFLLVVTGVAGLAIGYVNGITAPVIAIQEEERLRQGYGEIYPGADEYEALSDQSDSETIESVILAKKGQDTAGVLYIVTPKGYGGAMKILVGFDIAGQKITGIKILNQAETPGLGANCVQSWFTERFQDKTAASDLKVVKVETEAADEIQAITAATITTKAVADGVNAARADFTAIYGSN